MFFLVFICCRCDKNSLAINTIKETYPDDIADITFLNNNYYSTNHDLSGNAGSQIDLLKFSSNGEHIEDSFDLGMNGQGYLAITNDGTDIYLQSRLYYDIIKCSLIGERVYMVRDIISTLEWQASGLCYISKKDSLVLLYKNYKNPSQYRAITISKQNPFILGSDIQIELDIADTTDYGIYAITYKDSSYYMLGKNHDHNDILVITDYDFIISSVEELLDSTVTGLCIRDNDLYFSYSNRKIEQWKGSQ